MSGARVRDIRERLGLTQAAFAELVGVARNTVARWEIELVSMRAPVERLILRIAEEHRLAIKPKRKEGKTVRQARKRRTRGGP